MIHLLIFCKTASEDFESEPGVEVVPLIPPFGVVASFLPDDLFGVVGLPGGDISAASELGRCDNGTAARLPSLLNEKLPVEPPAPLPFELDAPCFEPHDVCLLHCMSACCNTLIHSLSATGCFVLQQMVRSGVTT